MEFRNLLSIFLLSQLSVLLVLDAFAAVEVAEGTSSTSNNPMVDYLLSLKKDLESHLNNSTTDFPTSVFCLPDYGMLVDLNYIFPSLTIMYYCCN